MVGPRGPESRGRFFDRLADDPAVETAAVALLLGVSDPLAWLARDGVDYATQVAVVRKAAQIRNDERTAELKAVIEGVGVTVGNRVGEIVVKALAAMFR